jgi:pimeloyl-ACP methyl ester carboxylesterase
MGEGKQETTAVTRKFIVQNEVRLEYFTAGEGDEVVVCLHGHGRTYEDYTFLIKPGRKWVALHLFFHGESSYPEKRVEHNPLTTSEFLELFRKLLATEHIFKFHLLAYSQGGRFAMIMLPNLYEQLHSVTLMAPDGLDNNSFYNRSSHQKWARNLFRAWEKNPSRAKRIARVAKTLHLVRPKVYDFVQHFLEDQNAFRRASLTWRGFRMLKTDEKEIARVVREEKIPFRIIMGKKDQVIRPIQAHGFAQRTGLDCVVEIPCNHNFFKPENRQKFIPLLWFQA